MKMDGFSLTMAIFGLLRIEQSIIGNGSLVRLFDVHIYRFKINLRTSNSRGPQMQ